ncbi:MAG: outer membrane protein assembly factor BamA, partial [Fidelibacterota bacterium]
DDLNNLRTFYRNHGYRDITVTRDSVGYTEDRRHMNIFIHLDEGPQYKYRNFSWEGNTLFTDQDLEEQLNLNKGDIFNEETFNLALYDRVQGLYMDRGYIYSQIQPQIMPVGEDSLDIHFVIQENHKVYVRNILIAGNTKTRENVIRRELKIYPGDVFNRNKLIRSQREVWILNYFSNVTPNVLPVDDDEVDLEITVEEKSSDRASANIGFTGEYGMTGGGGLEFTNFRGLGQRLNLSFNMGTNYSFYSTTTPSKYRSYSLSFTDPMIYDTPNLVGFSLFYTYRGASTNYSYPLDFAMRGASFTWGRRLRWPDDFFRGNWNLGYTQKEYFGTQEDLDNYVSGLGTSRGLAVSQVISRDSRDRPEFTTRGSRMLWSMKLSGGILGGNEDFHKHVLDLEWYTPTFWKFVLMSSFKIGVIRPLTSSNTERSIVPYDEKFIMGGNGIPYGNMLRGYPDNSIGPLTSDGRPHGGNSMLKFTTEFRIPFSENPVVYGLAFAEMGNVWNSTTMTEPLYLPRNGPLSLKRTVGVGIRFFMPMIGMLGFDMGYGFDDITGNGKPEGR